MRTVTVSHNWYSFPRCSGIAIPTVFSVLSDISCQDRGRVCRAWSGLVGMEAELGHSLTTIHYVVLHLAANGMHCWHLMSGLGKGVLGVVRIRSEWRWSWDIPWHLIPLVEDLQAATSFLSSVFSCWIIHQWGEESLFLIFEGGEFLLGFLGWICGPFIPFRSSQFSHVIYRWVITN